MLFIGDMRGGVSDPPRGISVNYQPFDPMLRHPAQDFEIERPLSFPVGILQCGRALSKMPLWHCERVDYCYNIAVSQPPPPCPE